MANLGLLVDLWLGRELDLSSIQYCVLFQYTGLGEVMTKWLEQGGGETLKICPSLYHIQCRTYLFSIEALVEDHAN